MIMSEVMVFNTVVCHKYGTFVHYQNKKIKYLIHGHDIIIILECPFLSICFYCILCVATCMRDMKF